MNPIKSFFRWMTNADVKERILTEFNPDIESKDEEIKKLLLVTKELYKKNQSLEGQLSKIIANKKSKETEQLNKIEDIELIKELKENSKEIERKKYDGSFALIELFKELRDNKKFRENFELVDRNDKKVFDIFYSFVILPNGNIGIQGRSGEIWSEGRTLNEVLFKPETIKNQIRRKRLLLPYDENYNYIPDLEKLETKEITYNEKDEIWEISDERTKPFISCLIERDKSIHQLRKDKAHHEQVITDFREKLKDMELAKESWKNQVEFNKSQLHLALDNEKQTTAVLGRLQRDLVVSQQQKEISDELKDKLRIALDKIVEELEENLSQTTERRKKDEVMRDLEWAKTILPEKTTVIEEEKLERPKITPGEVIRR